MAIEHRSGRLQKPSARQKKPAPVAPKAGRPLLPTLMVVAGGLVFVVALLLPYLFKKAPVAPASDAEQVAASSRTKKQAALAKRARRDSRRQASAKRSRRRPSGVPTRVTPDHRRVKHARVMRTDVEVRRAAADVVASSASPKPTGASAPSTPDRTFSSSAETKAAIRARLQRHGGKTMADRRKEMLSNAAGAMRKIKARAAAHTPPKSILDDVDGAPGSVPDLTATEQQAVREFVKAFQQPGGVNNRLPGKLSEILRRHGWDGVTRAVTRAWDALPDDMKSSTEKRESR
ncbi:hypothetical protein JYT83_00130 [bacterium AH-315-F18]|nr:hypothetical protein [bacterium AH-315-F18]